MSTAYGGKDTLIRALRPISDCDEPNVARYWLWPLEAGFATPEYAAELVAAGAAEYVKRGRKPK